MVPIVRAVFPQIPTNLFPQTNIAEPYEWSSINIIYFLNHCFSWKINKMDLWLETRTRPAPVSLEFTVFVLFECFSSMIIICQKKMWLAQIHDDKLLQIDFYLWFPRDCLLPCVRRYGYGIHRRDSIYDQGKLFFKCRKLRRFKILEVKINEWSSRCKKISKTSEFRNIGHANPLVLKKVKG